MSHSYTSHYPDVPIDDGIVKFFESFYKISDTPDAHEKYASQFTKDATFVLASKTSKGYDRKYKKSQSLSSMIPSECHLIKAI